MSKRPGIMVKLPDGRLAIVYNDQPLLEQKGRVLLHLIGKDYKPLLNEAGKQKTLIQAVEVYNEDGKTLIGYVD